jgi:hypothetical protein
MKPEPIKQLSEEEKLQRIEEMRLMGFDSQMRLFSQVEAVRKLAARLPIPTSLEGKSNVNEQGENIRVES